MIAKASFFFGIRSFKEIIRVIEEFFQEKNRFITQHFLLLKMEYLLCVHPYEKTWMMDEDMKKVFKLFFLLGLVFVLFIYMPLSSLALCHQLLFFLNLNQFVKEVLLVPYASSARGKLAHVKWKHLLITPFFFVN